MSHHPDGKILILNLVKIWLEGMSKLCTSNVFIIIIIIIIK